MRRTPQLDLFFALSQGILLTILWGCGNGRLQTDGNDEIKRESLATPMDYLLDDPACQETDGVAEIGQQPIYTWNGQTSAVENYPFTINSKDTVNTDSINATYFGYHQITTKVCERGSDGYAECKKSGTKILSKERSLKLCRPNGAYSRDSIEGVTLASIANIERAHSAYMKLDGAKSQKKTSLLILPNYESKLKYDGTGDTRPYEANYSITDNAAFAAVKGKNGKDDLLVFLVYPRSQETAQDPSWKDMRLWEIPWVMAHEYSHQIFYSHYQKYYEDTVAASNFSDANIFASVTSSTDQIWKHNREFKRPNLPSSSEGFAVAATSREVSVKDTITAVNEGFADLFAAQLLNGKKDHTQNLPCFEMSRDVLSPLFADGQAKVLTEEVRLEFFNSNKTKKGDGCTTNFQDGHHIGAIFAYGINEILMENIDAATDTSARAAMVLEWLNTFNAERIKRTVITPEDIWVLAIKAALVTAQGLSASLNASQCSKAKEIFPAYTTWLFDQGADGGFVCAPN